MDSLLTAKEITPSSLAIALPGSLLGNLFFSNSSLILPNLFSSNTSIPFL